MGRGTGSSESPAFLTPANMDRLVNKLTRMRGAALKLGQMLSIQGKLEPRLFFSDHEGIKSLNQKINSLYVYKMSKIDDKMLPTELEQVLLRVQNSANFMPEKQMRVSSLQKTQGSK